MNCLSHLASIALASIPFTQVAGANTLFVDANLTSGADDGSSWTNAFRGPLGLQNALASISRGASVDFWIADGTYRAGPAGAPSTATFDVPSGVALYGGFAGGERALEQRDPSV